jgi:unsaturated chondroitin disaccharide hydrolase
VEDPPKLWEDAVARMTRRIEDTARSVSAGFPHLGDPETGAWTLSANGDWTGGHWTGMLWLLVKTTGAPRHLEWARRWCEALRPRAASNTIFRAFLFYYGAMAGHVLMGDARAREIALEGARQLARAYNPNARAFGLGAQAEEASDVGAAEASIDALGPLCALLARAADEQGQASLRDAARQHALSHVDFCLRADGSICQSATFDENTGKVARRYTHKGYAENSTWARAQAWGMLGFALAARYLPAQPRLLEAAHQTADWWIARVPADKVAFWDFDHPGIPHTYRDTSASAIAAAALIKLAALTKQRERAGRYREFAAQTATALVENYLTPVSARDSRAPGILTEGCYNPRLNLAVRHELVWGDYYLFESLLALCGKLNPLLL